jgi:acyl-CoA dehydrogenase
MTISQYALDMADRVEDFVRSVVIPYEADPRRDHHGAPTDELVAELKEKARAAGVLSPHIRKDGAHLTQRETAVVLIRSGLSPLGPLACNTNAPDEGNMYLIGKVGSPDLKARFLDPLVEGKGRSAFLMTEPAGWGGAGSDPSMMRRPASRTATTGSSMDARPSSPATRARASASSWPKPTRAPACSLSTCPIRRSASRKSPTPSTIRCPAATRR